MPVEQHCSNILYNETFSTQYDFTASFSYVMNTSGFTPADNYGFSVFFIDGIQPTIYGGGCYQGLGVISPTDFSTSSAVKGVFLTLGFDIPGNFSKINGLPQFSTGTVTAQPSSICLRITSDFLYVSSVQVPYDYNLFGVFTPLSANPIPNASQTIRIGARNGFNQIDVYSLNSQTYQKLVSFNTNLTSIPTTAKFGIGYSGDTLFSVKNITMNYT